MASPQGHVSVELVLRQHANDLETEVSERGLP